MKSLDVVTLARFEFIQRYMGRDTLIDDRSTFMKQYIAYENEDVKDEKAFVMKLRGLNVLFQLQEEKEELIKLSGLSSLQENLEKFMSSDRVRVEIRCIVDSLLLGENRGNSLISRWSYK